MVSCQCPRSFLSERQKISCHQSGPLSPGSPVGVYVHLQARTLLWANAVLHVEPGLVQPHVTFQSNVIVSVSNPRVAKQVRSKRTWRRWRRLIEVHFLAAGCAEQVSSFYIRLCSSRRSCPFSSFDDSPEFFAKKMDFRADSCPYGLWLLRVARRELRD